MRHLPNILCILRLTLAPIVAAAIVGARFEEALALFWLAGVTDFADGYLARRFQWQSRLGGLIDPLADKALMAFTFVAMGAAGVIPWWLVALVFGRDLVILSGSALVASRTSIREFPPTWAGKVSTTVQILSVLVLLAVSAGWMAAWWGPVAVGATAAGTVVSGVGYVRIGWRMLRA